MRAILSFGGEILRKVISTLIVAALILFGFNLWWASANYTATQGTGTTFASVIVSAAHYMANLICDPNAGSTQCAAVSNTGALSTSITNTNANGQATMANSQPVVVASNQSNINTVVTNVNSNGQATSANSSPVVIASDQSGVPITTSGALTVQGNGTAGTADTHVVSVQGIASGTTLPVSGTVTNGPATTGGLTVFFLQPTASDNHTVVKNGAGQVYKIDVFNNSATVNYLRLYNAGTGFNGCNSATNLVYQLEIPALTSVGGVATSWDLGMAFATGISICVTSGYATTDATNATATAMALNIGYK